MDIPDEKTLDSAKHWSDWILSLPVVWQVVVVGPIFFFILKKLGVKFDKLWDLLERFFPERTKKKQDRYKKETLYRVEGEKHRVEGSEHFKSTENYQKELREFKDFVMDYIETENYASKLESQKQAKFTKAIESLEKTTEKLYLYMVNSDKKEA